MNEKKVKRLRRELRGLGHIPNDVVYKLLPKSRGLGGRLLGTIVLDPKCGRSVYRAAKQAARA